MLFLLLLLTPRQSILSQPAAGKAHSSVESEIDQAVRQAVNNYKFPGITVAVSKNGKLVVNKAYGYANYKERKPMKPYHRTGIGSVSKIITAIGIMKLTEEYPGFSVEQPLFGPHGVMKDDAFTAAFVQGSQTQRHPEWIGWYSNMRVNHLLSQTSGLERNGGDIKKIRTYYGIPDDKMIPIDKLVQYYLLYKSLLYNPGTQSIYSNIALGTFARMIVQAVAGKSYGLYIDQKIFKPLGLQGDILNHNHPKDEYDSDYHKVEDGKIETQTWSSDFDRGIDRVGAAGGWAASARSLVRLMVATDRLSNYPDILRSATLDKMETRPYPNIKGSHALGWAVDVKKAKMVLHNGAGPTGRAELHKYFPGCKSNNIDVGGINVAICVNSTSADLGALKSLATKLAEIVGAGNIPTGYDLFPESDPPPPSGANGKAGTIGDLVDSYKWSEGWTSAKFYKSGNQNFLLLLKERGFTSKGKNVHINKVNSNGTIGDLVASYKWSQGWSDLDIYTQNGNVYLIMIKSDGLTGSGKNVHINKVNSNGTIGDLAATYQWSEGWTDLEIFSSGGKTYLMLLKKKGFTSKGNNVHINKINSNGTIGQLVAGYKIGEGWTEAEFYKKGSQTYLMLLKKKGFTSKGQNVHINKINNNGTIGDLVASYKWSEGWSDAEFYKRGDKTFLFLIKENGLTSSNRNVHINLVNNNGTIGKIQAGYKWSQGWSLARFFKRGDQNYLFLLKDNGFTGKGKNVHINKVN